RELVAEKARRLGISRRDFVQSVLGTSTALAVLNQVYGCSYDVEETPEPEPSGERLMGDEFIFDVQTHHVNPDGPWRDTNSGLASFLAALPQGTCGHAQPAD